MKTLNSKLIFAALQIADILTTLACFHYGFFEGNPLTFHLIAVFGVVAGLVISKLLCCAVLFSCLRWLPSMRKLVWIGNVSYLLVVGWNLFIVSVVSFVKAMS